MIANLELYRVFYWTAREQNLSRAAERLFITQPTVSHAIKQLENELAVALFHRGPKGVTLTEEGQLLYAQVEQAFLSLETGERQIAEMNRLVRGELRLGSSDSLCKYYLLPSLGRFCNDHPHIRLNLQHGTTPEIVRYVKEGRIDFGIVRLPLQDESLVISETITVQDIFVAGPRYFHLLERRFSIRELTALPLILFAKASTSRQFIQDFASQLGVAIEPEIEVASVDLLIEFAKAGLGISFVTKQFVEAELARGELAELNIAETIPARKIGIVYVKNRRLAASSNVFLKQYLEVEPPGQPL